MKRFDKFTEDVDRVAALKAKLKAAGALDAFNALSNDQVTEVIRVASVESFQIVAFIPLILLPIFGLLWARENAKAAVNE